MGWLSRLLGARFLRERGFFADHAPDAEETPSIPRPAPTPTTRTPRRPPPTPTTQPLGGPAPTAGTPSYGSPHGTPSTQRIHNPRRPGG
jgi:hypothetical protein